MFFGESKCEYSSNCVLVKWRSSFFYIWICLFHAASKNFSFTTEKYPPYIQITRWNTWNSIKLMFYLPNDRSLSIQRNSTSIHHATYNCNTTSYVEIDIWKKTHHNSTYYQPSKIWTTVHNIIKKNIRNMKIWGSNQNFKTIVVVLDL